MTPENNQTEYAPPAWHAELARAKRLETRLEEHYGEVITCEELAAYAANPHWQIRKVVARGVAWMTEEYAEKMKPLLTDKNSFVRSEMQLSLDIRKKETARAARRCGEEKRSQEYWKEFEARFGRAASQEAQEIVQREYETAVGYVMHDIRGIIHPLYYRMERVTALGEKCASAEELADFREDVRVILERLKLLQKIADDIQELISPIRDASRPVEVSEMLSEAQSMVVSELMPQDGAWDVPISVECPKSLSVTVVRAQIVRAFRNILRNAVEACRLNNGGIAIVAEQRNTGVEIAFRDTGPGLGEKDLEMYRRFQPRSTSKKRTGSGFGLAIANAKITAHGGTLAMDSEKDKGTTLTVLLPKNGGVAL